MTKIHLFPCGLKARDQGEIAQGACFGLKTGHGGLTKKLSF